MTLCSTSPSAPLADHQELTITSHQSPTSAPMIPSKRFSLPPQPLSASSVRNTSMSEHDAAHERLGQDHDNPMDHQSGLQHPTYSHDPQREALNEDDVMGDATKVVVVVKEEASEQNLGAQAPSKPGPRFSVAHIPLVYRAVGARRQCTLCRHVFAQLLSIRLAEEHVLSATDTRVTQVLLSPLFRSQVRCMS